MIDEVHFFISIQDENSELFFVVTSKPARYGCGPQISG